ncbi:antitoxin Xre/MbcA/ParS toxin-binding domain-containing protein [Roseococcus sp. YIM B11640]|uniref:antitoxin Xre/MbcA/ParS toxin-binding domain-containing protein n=1 Tax=Roseococcus sp. YIM B11640 TaxID=3133973 RepID=UPI003C7EB046
MSQALRLAEPVLLEAIADAMGGERVLKKQVHSLLDLHRVILDGVPKGAVTHLWKSGFQERIPQRDFISIFASPATMKRRGALSVPAGERVERVARLSALAEQALGSREKGTAWLTTSHPMLGQTTPLELARTELGARQAERLLTNLLYDLPA